MKYLKMIHSDDVKYLADMGQVRAVASFCVEDDVTIGQNFIEEFDSEYGAYFPITIIDADKNVLHVDTRYFSKN